MIFRILLALGAAGLHAGEIALRVDPSVELAGAAQLFCQAASDPKDFRRPQGKQLELLSARFPNGKCVAVPNTFLFSVRAAALLGLTPRPELKAVGEVNREAVDAAGAAGAFEAWLEGLRVLARAEAKVEAHVVPETAGALAAAERLIASWAPLARFEKYAGYPLVGRQSLVLSQFLKRDAVYNVVERGGAGFEIATVVSADAGIGSEKDHWEEGLGLMLLHETAHGLLDDLADVFAEDIEARRPEGFKPESCNGSWHQCVKEHVASAAAGRMEAALFPDDASGEEEELPPGASLKAKLPYLKALEEALLKFELERKRWPTLAHFYPELLDAIGKPLGAAVPGRGEPLPERSSVWTEFLEARLEQGPSEALSAKRAALPKKKPN